MSTAHRLGTALFGILLLGTSVPAAAQERSERIFRFSYEATVDSVAAGTGPVDLFVPIAQTDAHQEILSYQVSASISGREGVEELYRNRFWHGHLDVSDGAPIRVRVDYLVRRLLFRNNDFAAVDREYTDDELRWYGRYLGPDQRVPVAGELVEPIVRRITPPTGGRLAAARASYEYVVGNMEYKKTGTGWGQGDTAWACSARYGNCTDFHALFSSLTRAQGIPTRFEIGFSVPLDQPQAEVAGYHCWAEFYLPVIGWVPVDCSEARKHPEQKDTLFGTHPADRVQFSIGRDLELGAGHTAGPINFFVYPYVEVAGKVHTGVSKRFAYQDLGVTTVPASAGPGAPSPGSALEPYGFIRLDTIFDDSRMQNDQTAFWVLSEDPTANPADDERLTMHPRLTRLGLRLKPQELQPGTQFRGAVEVDFQNGGSESREILRMRQAYLALSRGPWEFLAGQTWDLISPLNPAANNDGMMWNAGNLGDRRPQARLTWTRTAEGGSINAALALGQSNAVDSKDLDANGALDGVDAAVPLVQARIGMERYLKLGLWGHHAFEDTTTAVGGRTRFKGWAAGADLVLPLTAGLSLEGECWQGEDLCDVRGGIGQGVNTGTGREIASRGGWAQLAWKATSRWAAYAGSTLDDPRDADVPASGRTRNGAWYLVNRYKPWDRLEVGLEYLRWTTSYRGLGKGEANRVDLYLSWSF